MILEPWKSAEEIDKRLAALNDPELATLLRRANPQLLGNGEETRRSPAPVLKRLMLVAVAGLLALVAGFASVLSVAHHTQTKARPALLPAAVRHVHHAALLPIRRLAVHHRAPAKAHAPVAAAPSPVQHAQLVPAQLTAVRAEIAHERAIAHQSQLEAAAAQHRAQIATQAQERAQEQFLAQAQAHALAQARAQAQAEALARAQANAQELQREQDQAAANAQDPSIKPGDNPPADNGRWGTYPSGGAPVLMPGPVSNCTPTRGSILRSALTHIRVGGTSVGGLLNLIR